MVITTLSTYDPSHLTVVENYENIQQVWVWIKKSIPPKDPSARLEGIYSGNMRLEWRTLEEAQAFKEFSENIIPGVTKTIILEENE